MKIVHRFRRVFGGFWFLLYVCVFCPSVSHPVTVTVTLKHYPAQNYGVPSDFVECDAIVVFDIKQDSHSHRNTSPSAGNQNVNIETRKHKKNKKIG